MKGETATASSGWGIWCHGSVVCQQHHRLQRRRGRLRGGTDGGTRLVNNLIVGTPGRTAFACDPFSNTDLPNLDFNNVFAGLGGIAYNFACDDVTDMDGNISADPLFVDPNNGNFRLAAGSASVDAADNNANFLPFFDLDGNTRLFDGDGDMLAVVDHGAYEQGSKPPPPVDPNTWHVPADFATIQAAIDGAFPRRQHPRRRRHLHGGDRLPRQGTSPNQC